MNFMLDSDIEYTDRSTYDLLNLVGDVGGVLEILLVVFSAIAGPLSEFVLKALVVNRFFHLPQRSREEVFGQ